MSMKQLETYMSRVQSNDSIRDEVQRCGKDNSCVVKVGAKHGHKFSPAHRAAGKKNTEDPHDRRRDLPQEDPLGSPSVPSGC